jgi:hypothetical protein
VLIDCETCLAPASACRDCVVTFLLERPPVPVDLDTTEEAALENLVEAGLVPPLRLVSTIRPDPDATHPTDPSGSSGIRRDIA